MTTDTFAILAVVLGLLVWVYWYREPSISTFDGSLAPISTPHVPESPQTQTQAQQKEPLRPEDLLPPDEFSAWNEVNPEPAGGLAQSFLVVGQHIGIDTVGSSRKNANQQLRPDIPNPRTGGFGIHESTIEPDRGVTKVLM